MSLLINDIKVKFCSVEIMINCVEENVIGPLVEKVYQGLCKVVY